MSSDETANTNQVEEGVLHTPNMRLAQLRFILSCSDVVDKCDAKEEMLEIIKTNDMTPYYELIADELQWMLDDDLVTKMRSQNVAELQRLNDAIQEAKDNQGESEIRDAHLLRAQYLCAIGDKSAAEKALNEVFELSVGTGQRMDIVFSIIRLAFVFNDQSLMHRNLDRAQTLLEQGGDWDRRNRLKVYQGLGYIFSRNFQKASELMLEAVATFTCSELIDYIEFVGLTVLVAMISLPRPELKKKVIDGAEIQEALHSLPLQKAFLFSLYDCAYADFFRNLAEIETHLKSNRFLQPHRRYFIREMRVMVYQQVLESYASLTLKNMATSFGVSVEFIDTELSRFVAAGRLHCKIDKVAGVVETNRADKKNQQYQQVIKKGDLLLNRLQKLSQVINI